MYQIIFEENQVYEFAAEELANYYAKISGDILLRRHEPADEGTPIILGSPDFVKKMTAEPVPVDLLHDDGYWISVTKERIAITGKEQRSILYGVYRLLEEGGCRWMFPGETGEIIPNILNLRFEECEILDNPDFAIRTYTADSHEEIINSFIVEAMEILDWAAKNRLNTFFYSSMDPITGNALLQPLILNEITKRGFQIEIGGHVTSKFIPRELFDKKPKLFREIDGIRRSDGNFCSSNNEAINMVVDGVGALLNKLPSISCFHLWFEDVFDGAWCACEKCRNLTASEQIFQVIHAVASAYPQLHIDFIMYHDSSEVSSIPPEIPDNVSAYYAPRERCYTHCISDSSCQRNTVYYAQLRDAANCFSSVYPFEYYTDMILFNKMGTNFQEMIYRDLNEYKSLRVNAITLLTFNRYSWFAYKLAMATFAHTAWCVKTDYLALRHAFCNIYFKKVSDSMMEYYHLQEQFSKYMFQFCGYTNLTDIRSINPLEQKFSEKHLIDLDEAERILEKMEIAIENALKETDDVDVRYLLNSERTCLDFTAHVARNTHRIMKARYERAHAQLSDMEYNQMIDEAIEGNIKLAQKGREVPTSLVGINGKTTFIDHLCMELNDYYNWLKA